MNVNLTPEMEKRVRDELVAGQHGAATTTNGPPLIPRAGATTRS